MHEIGIARNIFELVQQQLPPGNEQKVKTIKIHLGMECGVSPDALRFGFQIAGVESPLRTAEIVIDEIPVRIECQDCGEITAILHPLMTCPFCNNAHMKILSGTELEVAAVELE